MKRLNPYSGLAGGLSAGELELLSDAVRERTLREETGFGTLAEAAVNLNLPRFRLHPYAASRAASSMCLASNSAGLRFPRAEWILTLL